MGTPVRAVLPILLSLNHAVLLTFRKQPMIKSCFRVEHKDFMHWLSRMR